VKPAAKPSFCADCAEPRADLVLRGVHWLSPSCDPDADAPQRPHRLGPERGYDAPEPRAPIGRTHLAFAQAATRVAGPSLSPTMAAPATSSRPGFVTIRVPRRRANGVPMDARFAEVQHRGTTSRYHLFDRPDVDLAREVRSTPSVDPMAELRDAVAAAGGGKP
jgi:hypothetical protein